MLNKSIPSIDADEKYRIIFRLESFTEGLMNEFKQGEIPIVDMGTLCVCCDEPTKNRIEIDPFRDNKTFLVNSDFSAPVCLRCMDHAYIKRKFHPWFWLLLISFLYTVFISYLVLDSPRFKWITFCVFILPGLVTVSITGFYSWKLIQKRNATDNGHFPKISILAGRNKELIIETSNKRLVKHFIYSNKDIIALISGTNESLAKNKKRLKSGDHFS